MFGVGCITLLAISVEGAQEHSRISSQISQTIIENSNAPIRPEEAAEPPPTPSPVPATATPELTRSEPLSSPVSEPPPTITPPTPVPSPPTPVPPRPQPITSTGAPASDFIRGYTDAGGPEQYLYKIVTFVIPCESSWNPGAVNPNGHYGLMQFSLSTWASVGGGDWSSPYQQGVNTAKLIRIASPATQWDCW